MAQFYSLDEAARVLGMSPEELKAKAQAREVRAFQDGGNWQFKVADVDELARRRGMGSDPDLSLSDLDLDVPEDSGSHDLDLSEFQLGVATPDLAPPSDPQATGSDRDLPVDDTSVPPELTGSSSTIIGMRPSGKQPSDSDVKLVPEDATRGAGDSDVRLAGPPAGVRPSDSDVTLVADDSVDDLPEVGSDPGATTLAKSPMLGSSAEVEAVGPGDSDSDFELTPSSVIDALQPDSGSDFELTALDQSDEFDSPPSPQARRSPSDSDVTGVEPSASGVNLGRPSDSGINLAAGGGFDFGEHDSIELAPLDEEGQDKPAAPRPAPKPAAKPKSDPGATALPVRDSGEKDIFEDTDFEVDALESGANGGGDDRTVQLEATSDFDIDDGDSASEVFAIDEENVDDSAATAMGAAPALDDDVFGAGVADEVGAEDAWGDVSGEEAAAASSPSTVPPAAGAAVAAAPRGGTLLTNVQGPEWGTPWVVMLGVTAVLMLLLAFVGHDLVTNLYEFRGEGVSSGLVKAIAGLMGGS